MVVPPLPPEIYHDILERVTPSWRWGWRWKDLPDRMDERAKLKWFLNLRLVNRVFDHVVIDLFHVAIRAGRIRWDLAIRRGPPTPSTLAMGRRLLLDQIHRDRTGSTSSVINTINRTVEGVVAFFARNEDSRIAADEVRTTYRDGLVAVFTGLMGTDLLVSVLDGTFDELDNLDEETEEWRHVALMAAAYLGRMDDMKELMAAGVDINSDPPDKWIFPSLMAAAFGGQEGASRYLIDSGANPHALGGANDENVLHYAVLAGNSSLVQFFLDIGVDAFAVNEDRASAFLWAAGSGRAEMFPLLLAQENAAANVNERDNLGRSPLIWATARGYDDVVEQLLKSENNIDVNTVDSDAHVIDVTALCVAAATGRENIFQMLFAHPDTDREANPLFWFALIGGRVSIVDTLIKTFPDILEDYERRSRESALLRAAEQGSEELVRYLLARDDILVNYQDDEGCTPLHSAVYSGDIGKVNALLQHPDVDVNLLTPTDNDKLSALSLAACERFSLDMRIVRALLDHPEINVNSRSLFDVTPLAMAALHQKPEMVKLLLARDDVDKSPIDHNGNTPLLFAAEGGCISTVGLLLPLPTTDVWHRNHNGETALAKAAKMYYGRIVRRLLDPGLGVTQDIIRDAIKDTKPALDKAQERYTRSWVDETSVVKARNIDNSLGLLSTHLREMSD